MKPENQTTVAKINNVEIVVIEDGEKRVAIKPICEALGVDFSSQLQKIKSDPILSSVVVMNTTTGADGKKYEMQTIPFKYVFGWLFQIDSRKVKNEARESVLRYQTECYNALYEHFAGYATFVEERQIGIDEQFDIVKKARKDFRSARSVMQSAEKEFEIIRQITFEQYKKENVRYPHQVKIEVEDEN